MESDSPATTSPPETTAEPSRLVPTRRAAVWLLAIDALLVVASFLMPWPMVAFAYIPLLLTAAVGLAFAGRFGLRVILFVSAAMLILLSLVGLAFAQRSFEGLLAIAIVGKFVVAALGTLLLVASCVGWHRFFWPKTWH